MGTALATQAAFAYCWICGASMVGAGNAAREQAGPWTALRHACVVRDQAGAGSPGANLRHVPSHPLPGAITSASVPTRPTCRLRPVPLRHDHTAVDATRLLSRGEGRPRPRATIPNLVAVRHNK